MNHRTPPRKSMQFPVVLPVAVAASVFGASGCRQQDREEPEPLQQANVATIAVASGDHILRTEAPLAVPDTTAGSDWLSITTDLRYDIDLGVLFLMDMFIPDPAIVGAGLVREGGRSRAVEALTIVRS